MRARRIAATFLLTVPTVVSAQTGAFVVRLGTDTIAVERFQRTGDRIEGTVVRHTPATNVVRYTITLNADGTVSSYRHAIVRADGSPMPNAPVPLTLRFTGDSVLRDIVQNGQPVTLRHAAPRGTLPTIPGSFFQYEMVIKAARAGAVGTFGFGAQQQSPTVQEVQFFGSDSAEIIARTPPAGSSAGLVLRTGFRLDATGNIIRSDGALTTQKFLVTRLPDADVSAIANAWAARDAGGQAMGAASTRDTVRATIGTAEIMIDYGRPAKRGREIWGKLVPYDTTWRLGANAATQFRTDKDLDVGGVHVPAGFYTLWLLPTETKSWLIVNKQTGQWGTAYDRGQDVARIPLDLHMNLPASEERFRIFVQGDMLMMHWDRGGYGVRMRDRVRSEVKETDTSPNSSVYAVRCAFCILHSAFCISP